VTAQATSASAFYAPETPPADPKLLPAYLAAEFQKIQRAIVQLSKGHVEMTYVAPAKPRDGDIRLADGTKWNPVAAGAPRFVGYYSGGWHLLG
jgi:hypothetical protein